MSNTFPNLFNMTAHKEVMVVDVWDFQGQKGVGHLFLLEILMTGKWREVERFLQILYRRKIMSYQEDQLLLKVAKDVFSARLMYKKLVHSLPIAFPSRSIWNPIVPPKIGFFAWETSWGKVLTLDQLKRRGVTLANRCFLCEEEEESIEHLLIHCPRAKMLWELFLAIVGSSPVRSAKPSLLGKALMLAKNAREFG